MPLEGDAAGEVDFNVGLAFPASPLPAPSSPLPPATVLSSYSVKTLSPVPPLVLRSSSGKRMDTGRPPPPPPSPSLTVASVYSSSPSPSPSPLGAAPGFAFSPSPSPTSTAGYSPSPSPTAAVAGHSGSLPTLVFSSSPKRVDATGLPSPSPTPSPTSAAASAPPVLVLSNSGKRIESGSKKMYVKQVTGRHNDTKLHLAVQRGDLAAVRQIIAEIDAQTTGTSAEFDTEVAEIRAAVINDANEVDETPLFVAAKEGLCEIVAELLLHSDHDSLTKKNRLGLDVFHVAATKGHQNIVQLLLNHDVTLSRTFDPSNMTPLLSAVTRGHLEVVKLLLERDAALLDMCKSNGKNALHFAARQGHVEIIKALLAKDPQMARKTDKKGQTALHMAVKDANLDVVKTIVEADPAIVMLPDRMGNTALHVATRKKRTEIVRRLLSLQDINVNALNRDHKTPYDIAEALPSSDEALEIKDVLCRHGAVRANDLNQPRDDLGKTVTEIKRDIHTQLQQARKTTKNVDGIAKSLTKLHRESINNATNSVTVVAVLFATVAFAAIFTVPGGNDNDGVAVSVHTLSFKVFYIFNAVALFTSLAVVVVQITLVRGETKAERRVVQIINKLMWLASVCTTVAFVSATYIVVGQHFQWAAVLVTVIGGLIMAGVLGTMTYYVVKTKRARSIRKREKSMKKSLSSLHPNSEHSESEIDRIYAL